MREVTCSVYTDIGSRPVNEDSAGAFECGDRQFFVLCDGLGGHGMGDIASHLTVQKMGECFTASDGDNPQELLRKCFLGAQDALLARQKELNASRKMKTTAVALLCDKRKLYGAHVGDSRLYLFRDGKVFLRTMDHSVPQMMVLSGLIQESEIRNHPERSILLRVLGVSWEKEETEYLKPVPKRKCTAFLLCSDGFWELIEENKMERCLAESTTAQEWLDKMAAVVKANGQDKNMDNNSAIAGFIR